MHANAVGTVWKKRPASLMLPRPAPTSVTSKGIAVAFDLKAQAYEPNIFLKPASMINRMAKA
jgi:hypothetical protein